VIARLVALGLTLLLALPACGRASGPSAANVVRDWSAALDAYDNERAASLFAPNIAIVQGDQLRRLRTHAEAVSWNARLPCTGKIASLKQNGSAVEVTFRLRSGRHRQCEDPAGAEVIAMLVVEHGKIVLWDQIGSQIRLAH
jgi:hypothetical protein